MAEPTKLGRYQLRRVLGKGAMGVVYEAFDPALNRTVAVKTILKSIVADEETSAAYSARFAREAKAVARLNHPHIVQVYDFGEQGDVAFLVMEFLRGRELRAYFDEQARFDTAEAVRIALELLDALEFAHESGVIHRDVKPANVMLDEQRRVKLADFGVARIQDGSERSKGGTMVGTPAFMSPEQVSGARVDRRTDLFATGIVLYQLLTGEQAFKGEGAWTVAKAIMQDEPPRPSTIAGKISPAFDAIVSKALAKRPDQRFASAKDFAAALRAAQAGTVPDAQVAGEVEVEFWRSIQASADSAEFRLYLRKFPQGVYAELAQLKLAKLSSVVPAAEPSGDAEEISALTQQAAQMEAQIARKEAEFREREAEAQTEREAEARRQAEADARREAELKARVAAEAKAHFEALEKVRREAQTALEQREAELRQREAEALAQANAEARSRAAAEARASQEAEKLAAKARSEAEARLLKETASLAKAKKEAEARARQEAEMLAAKARAEAEARAIKETAALAKAKEEAEARAKLEAAEHLRREADIAKREAEAAKRETALRKKLAESHRAKLPLVPALIAIVAIATVLAGVWYRHTSSEAARVAQLTELLETSTRANQQLDDARRQREASLRELDLARAREEDARKSGDLVKLKEAQDVARRAETEAAKQADLVKQREAEAKKADDTAKLAESKKQTDVSKAVAEKIAMEKAAAEKTSAEKAAVEKAALERAAAEKAAAEKAALESAAAEKLAAKKAAAAKAAAAKPGWPSVGDRWTYQVHELQPTRNYELFVTAESVDASSIRDVSRVSGGDVVAQVHRAGATIERLALGLFIFSPYLRAFQELRGDEQWSQVNVVRMPICDAGCEFTARVVGKERVTVRAGMYDAWKIVVMQIVSGTRGSGVYTYWYAEESKRIVKYQSRVNITYAMGRPASFDPDVDMELVSYTPTGSTSAKTATEKAPAEKQAAEKAAANSVEAQLERFIQRKGRDKVLKQEPRSSLGGTSVSEGVVYVNDGSCPPGKIREIGSPPEGGGGRFRLPTDRCISLTD